jgi:4,5-dihydroxyphthalate decarboxylase
MVGKLRLTVACGDYEIVRALKEGAVAADGLDLVMLTGMGPRERHWRMARKAEFDVCEANVGAYFMERDQAALASEASGQRGNFIVRAPDTRPEPGLSAHAALASEASGQRGNSVVHAPLTAIPVFLHRRFRHGFLFVNAAAGIRAPKDLIGRKVGGTNFQPASNIWMRGILEEDYGLPHRQVTWVVERSEDVAFTPPKDLRIEMIAPGKALDVMLAEGEIPAMLSPELPRLFLAGDKRIIRMFPDYKEIELAYFRRTGIFPIMHVTTIRQEIVDKYPWVPTNLVKAFEQAKNLAYRRIANPRMVPIAWVRTALEEQEAVLGPDPWAYGLTPANRKNLETVQRYTFQQGMVSRMQPLDALFADTDLGDAAGPDGI